MSPLIHREEMGDGDFTMDWLIMLWGVIDTLLLFWLISPLREQAIRQFLQSFWADIKRKKSEDGISNYIQLFEAELFS